ncbi:hypothetical protein ACX0MV_19125 [Pseudomonas borbori]
MSKKLLQVLLVAGLAGALAKTMALRSRAYFKPEGPRERLLRRCRQHR